MMLLTRVPVSRDMWSNLTLKAANTRPLACRTVSSKKVNRLLSTGKVSLQVRNGGMAMNCLHMKFLRRIEGGQEVDYTFTPDLWVVPSTLKSQETCQQRCIELTNLKAT